MLLKTLIHKDNIPKQNRARSFTSSRITVFLAYVQCTLLSMQESKQQSTYCDFRTGYIWQVNLLSCSVLNHWSVNNENMKLYITSRYKGKNNKKHSNLSKNYEKRSIRLYDIFANDHGRVGGSGSLAHSVITYVAALVCSLVAQREAVLRESSCSL